MTHAQAHVTTDRRIAAGDWVRMTGLAPSLRGVGKVVDADYDPKDDAMRAALVDMGAREYWIPVAELARVLPDEEARLVAVARERRLIDEELAPERARRLERALEAVTRGTASFVRSPGLLDLLWPFTSHADRDHGSRALSGLFDDALDLLVAARLEATAGALTPPRPVAPTSVACEVLAPWTPAFAPDEVLPRVLGQLDRVALVARAEALGLEPVRGQGAPELRGHLARHVTAAQLVDVLWVSQLRRVCRDGLDMRDAAEVDPDVLRARVKSFVAPLVETFAPWTASTAPDELVPGLLAGVDRVTLVWRAEAMGIDVQPVRAAGTDELRAFVAARTTLPRLLDVLSPPQLREACRQGLGMTDADDLTREELRARLLGLDERAGAPRPGEASSSFHGSVLDAVAAEARAEAARALMDAAARVNAERQRQGAAAREAQERQLADAARARRTSQRLLPPARPDEVLPRILGTLNHQPLLAIAGAHELTAPSTRRESHQALISAILRAGLTLEAVLAHLTPNQLRLACGAIGLRGALEGDPDALRARLLAAAAPASSPG